MSMPEDISLVHEAIESFDVPKEPIAWLMARVQEKADHYRETGNQQKARELDDRASWLRVFLRNARIATVGDERANPELFKRSELDRLVAAQAPQSKAHARAKLKQLVVRRKAYGTPAGHGLRS